MPVPEPEGLGLLIRHFRRGAGLSQDDLAARSGVSARAISDLERGQRRSAHFETVRMLADALDLSSEDRAKLIRAAQSPWIDITLQRPPAADAARRGLPAPPTRLIGRGREVADLAQELASESSRLITLTGPGGVGKTRLALAAASAASPHFPGGVAWIDLAPVLDPGAVMAAIAGRFGLDESGTSSPIDNLCGVLGDRRFLLVLDNFEHVIDAAPVVASLLTAAPSLAVLVTSRAPLNLSAEMEYPVAPLPLPDPEATIRDIQDIDAVRLFVDRARAVQRDFCLTPENGEAVAQICRRLEGLPLAIELAASRVNVLAPRLLLDRLEQRLPLLTRGARDAPLRQQTMSNAIAWSYNLLDADAQWLFRRLSVFVGGFTFDTVDWVMGSQKSPGVTTIDALSTLAENNLVFRVPDSPDGTRFTMFETVREFGIAQLSERRELQQAYEVLASYCRRLARFGDGIPSCIVPEPWLAMVDQERSNIHAAHDHLARSNDAEALLEFTAAYGHYLYLRGPLQEAWAWFEQALDATVAQPTPVRLQGLYWACHLTAHLRLTEKALQLGNEALKLAQALGDVRWHAATVHCLALIQQACGHVDQAAALFEEQLRLWEEAGVQGLSGFALMCLGEIAFLQGDLVRAHTLEEEAAKVLYEMGGLGWVAVTKWLRGLFSASEGRLHEAAGYFCESLRLSIVQNSLMVHHNGLVGLAYVASELALHGTAGRLVGATETVLEQTGQQLGAFEGLLYDRSVSASRSAMGAIPFDEARRLGAATDHAAWLASGEAIKRAAERALVRDGDRVAGPGATWAIRSHAAAD